MMYRKLSKGGFVTLPAELRRALNLQPGDVFEMEACADGVIVMTPMMPRCVFCNSNLQVEKYKNQHLCENCRKELTETETNDGRE